MRFKNYLKGLVLATALYGANLMGAQTDAPALKPEIRSSETPIVQVERSAGQRLQQEVERDGGTVEGQEVTAGEKANAAVQDFANDVYGAGDKVEDFLRENIGNAGGTIFGAPVKVVTGLTGGLTQGAGYVAQGATDGANWVYDNALAPTGEFFADGWNKFTGLFSSEEKAPEAPATPAPAETKVEGQTAPAPAAPQVETQTEDNRNIFERGWDGLTGAVEDAHNFMNENVYQPTGEMVQDAHNFMNENVYQPTGNVVSDIHETMDKNVYTPVGDAVKGMFSSEEKAPETPATPAPAETKVEGQTAPAPATPQVETQTEDNRNIFERGWDGLTGAVEDAHNFMNENVYQPTGEMVQDAHNFMNENVYQPTGNVVSDIHKTMDKNVYTPVGDAVKGMFSSEEKAPEAPATPAPEAQAEDAPAPAAPQAETQTEDNRNIFERGWDGLTGAVEDAHNFMNENVYQPTGKMVQDAHNFMNENVYTPVGDAVKGMFSSEEKAPETPATPAPEAQAEDAPAPAAPQAETQTEDNRNIFERGWDGLTGAVEDAHNFMNENVYQPTGKMVQDAHNFMNENVYQPVGGAVKGMFTSEEKAPEAPAPVAPQAETDIVQTMDTAANAVSDAGRTVRETLAEKGREYLGPLGEAGGNILGGVTQLGTGLADLTVRGTGRVAEFVRDAHNFMNENVYQPTGNVVSDIHKTMDKNVYTPVGDAVKGMFSSEEKAPEAPATPAPEAQAEDAPAPAAPQAETQTEDNRNIFERGWDGLTGAVEDAHNFMNENVYQPTGKMVQDAHNFMNENVYTPVGDAVKGMFSSEEKAPEAKEPVVTMPSPAGTKEQAKADDKVQEEKGWFRQRVDEIGQFASNAWDKTVETVGDIHKKADEVIYTPVGNAVKDLVTPDRTEEMNKLSEFLKSKGLSDADIKQAVSIALGKQAESSVKEVKGTEIPAKETPSPAVEEVKTQSTVVPEQSVPTEQSENNAVANLAPSSLKDTLRLISDERAVGDYVLTGKNTDATITVTNPNYFNTGRA